MPEESVLRAAADAFGLDFTLLAHVGGNVNGVYQYPAQHGHPARVLRLTHQNWRTAQEALAELHFMTYLFDNGVSVPEIFPSCAGATVEDVTNGYHASLFSKAAGRSPIQEDWNPKLFINWGRMVGQMHLLTQSYIPSQGVKRRDWHQESWMDILLHLPQEEQNVRQQAIELLDWIKTLPTDVKNYGLVHCDLHAHNIVVSTDGSITAFDFDDSCYHWFAYDVAVILYSVITRHNRQDDKHDTLDDHVAWFLDAFLKGYQDVQTIENWWLKAMPKLLSYRRLIAYNFFHQRHNWKTIDGHQKLTWLRMKSDIERDVPLTNYAFE
ncbi:MAG: phosphotransferase [Alicyclobacillus sp.]|nr:phosphotransferase [Alicyclobacillus sp.]